MLEDGGSVPLTADERDPLITLEQRRLWRDRRGPVVCRAIGDDLVVQHLGLGRRCTSQFLRQHLLAVLVLADGIVVPSQQRGDPHHPAVSLLPKRVLLGEAPGMTKGRLVVAPGHGEIGETIDGGQEPLPEPTLIGEKPVVVEAGEEITPIQGDRPGEQIRLLPSIEGSVGFSLLQGPLEIVDVEPELGFGIDPHRVGVGDEEAVIGIAHCGLDLPQCMTEAAAGPALGKIGPERAGQEVAGVSPVAVEDQEGEQGTGRPQLRCRDGDLVAAQLEAAEKTDLQGPHRPTKVVSGTVASQG